MSGAVSTSRAALTAQLTAAGVRVADSITGPIASPCAVITPGDPWLERQPAGMTGDVRRVRWRIVLVAGVLDADGTLALLEQMIDRTVPALVAGRWEQPTSQVSAPHRLPHEGVTYLSCELIAGQLVTLAAPASEVTTDG